MKKKRLLFSLLAVCCLLVVSGFFLWHRLTLVDSEASIPIKLEKLPDDLIVSGQPPKEVEVLLRGQKITLKALQEQKLACILDLTLAKAGLLTLPIGESNLRLPEGISVVHIEPTSITLRIEPKLTKTVPVTITLTDNPASGYKLAPSLSTPSVLEITGPEKILTRIDHLATLPISIKDMSESFKKEIAVDLPSEVTIGKGGSSVVTAQVNIEENIITRRFENIPVKGRDTVLSAKITPPDINIDVRGPENTLSGLSVGSDIQAYVDLKGLTPGTYARRAQITLPVGTTLDGADPEVFTVTIKP